MFFPDERGNSDGGYARNWSDAAGVDVGWLMKLYYKNGTWDSRWLDCTQEDLYPVRPVLNE